MLERIEAFNEEMGGGVVIHARQGGYSLYIEEDGSPLARLRSTGDGDVVEVLYWSYRDRWESIGDFDGVFLPLDDTLNYIAENPDGCFGI